MRLRSIISFFFLLSIAAATAYAGDDAEILLLNSSRSVEKYRVVQEEFKDSISHRVSAYMIDGYDGEISDLYRTISRGSHRLIYCIGTKAYLAAMDHAPEKMILFSSINNWRRLPQGDGVYGISNELHPAMHLMHYKNIFPNIRKIGVLYSKEFNEQWIALAREAGPKAGVAIISKDVPDIDLTNEALETLLPEIDALWLIADPIIISSRKNLIHVIQVCDQHKIPVFSYNSAYGALGATLVVAVDDSTIGRQAAVMSEDLLAGRPLSRNVQYPAGSHITVNLDKVRAFGISYNHGALETVNTIVDSAVTANDPHRKKGSSD